MRPTIRRVDGFAVPAFGETVVISLYAHESDPIDEGKAISIQGTLFLIKEVTWMDNHEARYGRFVPHYNLLITPLTYYSSEPETSFNLETNTLKPGDFVEKDSFAIVY